MCCLSVCAAVHRAPFAVNSQMCTIIKACCTPLEEASAGGCTFQKSGGLCLLLGLHYHTRGLPDRLTATLPEVKPPALTAALGSSAWVQGLHGVLLFSILLVCVDSDGTSKQNRGEAMWPLHSHGAPAQWIRLMLAREGREVGSVSVRPSSRGVDGLGLCQGPCWPEGRGDEGRQRGDQGLGAAQSKDQQHVDKGLSCWVCCFSS